MTKQQAITSWVSLLPAAFLASCLGEDIHLGGGEGDNDSNAVLQLSFAEVQPVAELNSEEKDENPSLSSDLLEICFTSKREGGQGNFDLWCASRASMDDPFTQVQAAESLNSEDFESSSALSADGLTLWFSSEQASSTSGSDIWSATRDTRSSSWNEAALLPSLNSEDDDIPRPVGASGLIMPMASRRDGGTYRTYLAKRDSPESDFSTPELLSELDPEGYAVVDAFLTEEGLLLIYNLSSLDDGKGDLYYSVREALDAPFGPPQEVIGLNTADDERDPWLSPDGQTLYFVSDRLGKSDIFQATRTP